MTVRAGASEWFVRFQPNATPRLRLLCFPHAGGGSSVFRSWAAALPRDLEVCAFQLPGREERLRERPFSQLGDVVRALDQAVASLLDCPFAFFGHSLGALTAFELARSLRDAGRPGPLRLFVAGRRAPHQPETLPPVHVLPDAALVDAVRRRWGGIPAAVLREPELLELLLPTLRADLTQLETYRYAEGEPLPCPISCFGGTEDPNLAESDLVGWRVQTQAEFRLRLVPGGHFFLQSARDLLLAAVREDVAQVSRPPRRPDPATGRADVVSRPD